MNLLSVMICGRVGAESVESTTKTDTDADTSVPISLIILCIAISY